jgi:hypothetical protein
MCKKANLDSGINSHGKQQFKENKSQINRISEEGVYKESRSVELQFEERNRDIGRGG